LTFERFVLFCQPSKLVQDLCVGFGGSGGRKQAPEEHSQGDCPRQPSTLLDHQPAR